MLLLSAYSFAAIKNSILIIFCFFKQIRQKLCKTCEHVSKNNWNQSNVHKTRSLFNSLEKPKFKNIFNPIFYSGRLSNDTTCNSFQWIYRSAKIDCTKKAEQKMSEKFVFNIFFWELGSFKSETS